MIEFISNLEDEFIKYMQNLSRTAEVGSELLIRLDKVKLDIPCQEFNTNYLLMLFIQMRIYYCLKFANRVLEKPKKHKNRKCPKITHI